MPTVHYTFDLTRPHTHLVGVEVVVPATDAAHTDLVLPSWIPGAYKIVDNARNVRCFTAEAYDGTPLPVTRRTKQIWRVEGGQAGFRVRYDVYANKPEIHQAQLDAHHAFLNPGVLAVYVDGHKEDWDVKLRVEAPEDWRVATALAPAGPGVFAAVDYEEFVDCPLEVGCHSVATFELDGVRYEVVYEGATPWNPERLVPALERIVIAATDLFGRPPLDRYVFMYLETGADFLNGLEHRTSTIITGPVTEPGRQDGLIAITAHEFIHLWNVKRLRPLGLGPFDYTREAHTTGLWVVEGFTEYYTDMTVLRAGLQSPEAYLAGVAGYVQQLESMPGRRNMSLEEASWTTWHFGDDRWNGALNYYVKGYLLGVALDLELRGRSANQVSLDDVMRAMWDAYGAKDVPYDPIEVCRTAESLLGESLEPFWAAYLRGREDFDWERVFAPAGLELVARAVTPSLELSAVPAEGGLRLEKVLADGAAQAAGLMAGDVLVAVGGLRVTPQLLSGLDGHVEPGDAVEVHYFRRDQLRSAVVTLGRHASYAVVARAGATAEQLAVRTAWLAKARTLACAQA